jgi:hypothetical protein
MRDREREILTQASDLNPDGEKIRCLLSGEADVDELIEGALREGLAGFLYRGLLKSESLECLNPADRTMLESAYYRTLSTNLMLIKDLKEVLCRAKQRKIRVVLIQGMDLLYNTYGDIGLRPMTDVDLWVGERDFPAMVDLLDRLGYERDTLYPTTFRKSATLLDLHTSMLWADRIRARKKLLNIEEEAILAKTRSITVEGEEAFCLDPYDQFIHLGLHALKHRANRLMWLVDLKTLARGWEEPDWKALWERAREMGQEKTLSCILFLLKNIFSLPIPETMDNLPCPGPLAKRILRQRIEGDALPPWGPAFLFSSGKGPVRGLPIFWESLFPRPEVLRQIFPESNRRGAPWLYLKRAVQLLGLMGGQH